MQEHQKLSSQDKNIALYLTIMPPKKTRQTSIVEFRPAVFTLVDFLEIQPEKRLFYCSALSTTGHFKVVDDIYVAIEVRAWPATGTAPYAFEVYIPREYTAKLYLAQLLSTMKDDNSLVIKKTPSSAFAVINDSYLLYKRNRDPAALERKLKRDLFFYSVL